MGRNPEPSRRPLQSFFKVMFGDFSKILLIPPAFLKHFDGVIPQEFVLRTRDGSERRVSVVKVGKDVFFKSGWSYFVRDNAIDFGDFLVFSYNGYLGLNVAIFRKETSCEEVTLPTEKRRKVIDVDDSDCASDDSDTFSPHDRFRSNELQPESIHEETTSAEVECVTPLFSCAKVAKTEATQGNARAVEAANEFTSKLPFFRVIINVSNTTYLHLPRNFDLRYLKDVQCIMLQISKRSWPVKVLNYKHICRISAGWPAFMKDNTLQEGDACVFEMKKGRKIVFNVSIFRCTR